MLGRSWFLARNRDFDSKIPLDVKIVVWMAITGAIICFMFATFLALGIMHGASDYNRLVVFGIFSLNTDLKHGVYVFLQGVNRFLCAYGLKKGYKFGWWLTMLTCIYDITDSILMYDYFHNYVLITGICLILGMIIWLLYRKPLYNIGCRPQKLEA